MPRFKDIRSEIKKALERQEHSSKSIDLYNRKIKNLQEIERKLSQSGRDDQEYMDSFESIGQQIIDLKSQIKVEKDRAKRDLEYIEQHTDPRERLPWLDDRNPILLFPIRIETRFKKVSVSGRIKDQLWVRVYPDEIAIDTFEKDLTENEVDSVQNFWHRTYQAGGNEDLERAAWRELVTSYGSGRSQYLIKQYTPENRSEIPEQIEENQFYLTIGLEEPLDPFQSNIIASFWIQMWLAGNEKEKRKAALNQLRNNLPGTSEGIKTRVEEILERYEPVNFKDRSKEKERDLKISVIFIEFPSVDNLKQQSWSTAPETYILPERFVITAYNRDRGEESIAFQEIGNPTPIRLKVGPDPSLSKDEQLKQLEDGNIRINHELKWLFDFDEAVAKGMGFKIDLTPEQATKGFDKIVVLGVKLHPKEKDNIQLLETLFEHHNNSLSGLSILPQGTPSNNTQNADSIYSEFDNPDVSFEYRENGNQYNTADTWAERKDGHRLAHWLGLDSDLFQKTTGASHTDQVEALAMNTVLFPSTLGYTIGNLMSDVFSETADGNTTNKTTETTRFYFRHYVSARGVIPSIRVGNQPYGILPTTNFQQMQLLDLKTLSGLQSNEIPWHSGVGIYTGRLLEVIKKIDQDWSHLLRDVAYIGKKENLPEDSGQLLMDVLGLAPNSLEHYQRYSESLESIKNQLRLLGWAGMPELWDSLNDMARELLNELGYNSTINPEILQKVFLKEPNKLMQHLIDDYPLSETREVRAYTNNDENYIEWLIQAAKTSHDALRKQKGFKEDKVPASLLYIMMHHALDLEYVDLSLNLFRTPNTGKTISEEIYWGFKKEPNFIHLKSNSLETESRWKYLYQTHPEVTGSSTMLIGNYIPTLLNTNLADSYFKKQLEALEQLKNVPTARLERLLVEHIDLCSYRLDAWKQSFMTIQLALMRNNKEQLYPHYQEDGQLQDSTYIGAYGWLENVRSKEKELKPKNLEENILSSNFNQPDEPQLMTDSKNEGYVTAPSLNQAVTAAILRNAYLSNDNPETFEVNLSSERVRKALSLIEGIRGGQNLAALLGYHFERELHDQYHTLTEIDYHIYQMRKAFPLSADKLKSTQTEESIPIEAIEARNVLDGLALINHVKETGKKEYPFGISSLSNVDVAIKKAINKQVDNIMNLCDAVADIAVAEGVHQAVLGNYNRSGAVMESYGKGNLPPIPEVIQTPRSGTSITQRFGLQFKAGLPGGDSPRSKAEPAINDWLMSVLPEEDKLVTKVKILYFDGTKEEIDVSQKKLNLQPIDLLYEVNTESTQAMTSLDDRIERYVYKEKSLRPDDEIKILYTERDQDKINFFQINALLNSLRALLLESRPLEPIDIMVANNFSEDKNPNFYLDAGRITNIVNGLHPIVSDLELFIDNLHPLTEDINANKNALIHAFDETVDNLIGILGSLSEFGLAQSSTGFLFEKKQVLFKVLISKLTDIITSWNTQLTTVDEKIEEYNNLPADASLEEKLKVLYQIERDMLTESLNPRPEDPEDLKNVLIQNRAKLNQEKNDLENLITDGTIKAVNSLLQSINTKQSEISKYYFQKFSVEEQEESMLHFMMDMVENATSVKIALEKKIDQVGELLSEAEDLVPGKNQVERIQKAGKLIFGEDFKMVPEFEMPAEADAMWEKSYQDSEELLTYLKNDLGRDFPIDEWTYSLARVKEKVQHWENILLLTEAFGVDAPQLKPVQFPYQPNDLWLASDFPDSYKIDEDKLLYIASYAEEFTIGERQCGLLLDEWTELIPSKKEDIGIAFHYDKPDSEPPQALLLALPTKFKREWTWEDLMNIVTDTLEQAKKRAIEPDHINELTYGRFLPATVAPVSVSPITSMLNYAAVNGIFDNLNTGKDE